MTARPSVLIACGHLIRNIANYTDAFDQAGVDIYVPTLNGQQFSEDEMLILLPTHDVAILGDDHVTARVIDAAKSSVKALIKWGIGTDNIDLEAAKAANIPVYNTPGQFSNEVADLALGMMLSLARQIHLVDRRVRQGKWLRVEGESISGSSAHIIGMGNIAQAIAQRLLAFNVMLTGSDPFDVPSSVDFPRVELNEGLAKADWVFAACALTPDNIHLINEDTLSMMKPGARLVNVSRGSLVDEEAIIRHLQSGHLAGAALDVFEQEPFSPQNPLASLPQVVLGSHSGSSTRQAIARVNDLTVEMAIALIHSTDRDGSFNRVNA